MIPSDMQISVQHIQLRSKTYNNSNSDWFHLVLLLCQLLTLMLLVLLLTDRRRRLHAALQCQAGLWPHVQIEVSCL
jgi:hypothetical protein